MKKIKILKYFDEEQRNDYNEYIYDKMVIKGITEWEEVDDNTYLYICTVIQEINRVATKIEKQRNLSIKYAVIVKSDDQDIKMTVAGMLKWWKDEQLKYNEEEKKRKSITKKAAATRKKNQEGKERKQLEELKKKYGS